MLDISLHSLVNDNLAGFLIVLLGVYHTIDVISLLRPCFSEHMIAETGTGERHRPDRFPASVESKHRK